MRKIITILLVFTLLFACSACASEEDAVKKIVEDKIVEDKINDYLSTEKVKGVENAEDITRVSEEDAIKKVVENEIYNCLSPENIESMIYKAFDGVSLDDSVTGGSAEEFSEALSKRLKYSITDVNIQGNRATVTANITNVDFGDAFEKDVEEASHLKPKEQATRTVEDMLSLGDEMMQTVNVSLIKTGGKWEITNSDALFSAASGGMYETMQGLAAFVTFAEGLSDALN